jgi:SAM-dependent methyltransferase
VTSFTDPEAVREEYSSDDRLAARAAAHRFGEGPDARELAFEALAEGAPRRVLEVGCGQGWMAERIARELGADVVALDQSEHMVELTRARGIEALVGDVQELPFEDAVFDTVVALWMLYHVQDVDRALAELARVLEPGGRVVAVTNAGEHLRELYAALGLSRRPVSFASDEAEQALARHFAPVERRDAFGWTDFPDRAAAQRYVDASPQSFGGLQLPAFDGPLRVRRAPTIFVAHKPAG